MPNFGTLHKTSAIAVITLLAAIWFFFSLEDLRKVRDDLPARDKQEAIHLVQSNSQLLHHRYSQTLAKLLHHSLAFAELVDQRDRQGWQEVLAFIFRQFAGSGTRPVRLGVFLPDITMPMERYLQPIVRWDQQGGRRFILLSVILLACGLMIFARGRQESRSSSGKGAKKDMASPVSGPVPPQDEITALRRENQQLRRMSAIWRSRLDLLDIPVIFLNTELEVEEANKTAAEFFTEEKKLIGKSCWELFSESSFFCRICPAYLEFRETSVPKEHEVEHCYHGRTLRVSCLPVTHEGELIGYALTAKDLTQQKELEKQLTQAQKMEAIATLAGGIAHDFNNILGVILGNTELILYRLPEGGQECHENMKSITFPEVGEHLQAIRKAGNRAKDLVQQILAFSRQGGSTPRDVDIRPIVKEAIKLLRSSLPSTIEIKFNLASEISKINADPTQIQQVLMNLCVNAAQAMESAGGVLTVQLAEMEAGAEEIKQHHGLRQGRYLVLSVADTGQGMSRETLARIFDPFFTTRGVGKGSGLGLSVVHGIMLANDGIIDVASEEGKGSVFKLFFPCVAEVGTSGQEVISMPRGEEGILFVDDEEEILKMRQRMLEFLGYKVFIATAGDQALAILHSHPAEIEVVITDLTMPRMTGLQLAGEIMKVRPDLPIILCSGYSEVVSPEEASKAGVRKFMAKPLVMRALATAIREVLAARE